MPNQPLSRLQFLARTALEQELEIRYRRTSCMSLNPVVRRVALGLASASAIAVLSGAGVHTTPTSTDAGANDGGVPILMYHLVSDPPPNAPFPELYVRPGDFRGEMRWLARHGYTALTLKQVWAAWHGHTQMPARPVVLTFDDGYRSIATRAGPILRSHHWPGVLNLKVGNISNRWGFGAGRVRGLIRAGWEVDSHTLTHPDLTTLDAASLRHEVSASRTAIRRRFHVPVHFFCYPSGRYNDRVVAAVEEAGYLGATTTNYGVARLDDPYRLDRVRVNRSDGIAGFAAKMTAVGRS